MTENREPSEDPMTPEEERQREAAVETPEIGEDEHPEAAESGDAEPDGMATGEGAEDEAGLPEELEQVTAQAAEYLDGWQRARAELANYKKRVERERQEAYVRAAGDILTQQLEVLDDLERALEDRPTDGEPAVWADGIELVYRKLQAILEGHGVEPINASGQPFDPNYHEAISHEETDDAKPGHVIDVIKQGYRMGDRVLRPALVRVAK